MSSIGANFNEILKERGLRKSDVARATGVSKSCVSEWSNGRYVPKLDKVHKIADYLGVSPAILLDDSLEIHEIPEPTSADDYVELIDLYVRLNDNDKYLIVEMAKNMLEREIILKKYMGLINDSPIS